MYDRLAEILKFFNIRAKVFHTGNLCGTANFDGNQGVGHIHVLNQGSVKIISKSHPTKSVSEPSLFVYMNPTAHQLQAVSDDVDLVCASFECGINSVNPLSSALVDLVLIELNEMGSLKHTLNALFSESNDLHCGHQAVLDRLMEVVIIQSLRFLMDTNAIQSGLLAGLANPNLSKAITAVHENPAEKWSLETMAATAGMSRSRFAAKFLNVVGSTPGNYLSDWRFNIAQTLLLEGKSIQFIADAIGFNSASALSRSFRKRFGCSPSQWMQSQY